MGIGDSMKLLNRTPKVGDKIRLAHPNWNDCYFLVNEMLNDWMKGPMYYIDGRPAPNAKASFKVRDSWYTINSCSNIPKDDI